MIQWSYMWYWTETQEKWKWRSCLFPFTPFTPVCAMCWQTPPSPCPGHNEETPFCFWGSHQLRPPTHPSERFTELCFSHLICKQGLLAHVESHLTIHCWYDNSAPLLKLNKDLWKTVFCHVWLARAFTQFFSSNPFAMHVVQWTVLSGAVFRHNGNCFMLCIQEVGRTCIAE